MGDVKYSWIQGIVKAVKYIAIFAIAGLTPAMILSFVPQPVKELTVAGIIVLVLNFLKVKCGVKI